MGKLSSLSTRLVTNVLTCKSYLSNVLDLSTLKLYVTIQGSDINGEIPCSFLVTKSMLRFDLSRVITKFESRPADASKWLTVNMCTICWTYYFGNTALIRILFWSFVVIFLMKNIFFEQRCKYIRYPLNNARSIISNKSSTIL